MYDWLELAQSGQRVLDLASASGSFVVDGYPCTIVQVDEDPDAWGAARVLPDGPYFRVFGRSRSLPFADATFDLIICSHALEHLEYLDESLDELGRVLKPHGRVYVSVPNGYGLCDGVYRWLFEGGGHINRLRREELVRSVEASVGVKLVRWQRLYSSFVYLHRLIGLFNPPPPDLAKRLLKLAKWPRVTIKIGQHVLYRGTRWADRWFGSDLAVYGWAMYFERGGKGDAIETPAYINVCMYCGSGHGANEVVKAGRKRYVCTSCNAVNPWFKPFGNTV